MILFMKDLQRAVAAILQRRSADSSRRADEPSVAAAAVDAQYLQALESRVRDMEVRCCEVSVCVPDPANALR
jgi:hypothetical protein